MWKNEMEIHAFHSLKKKTINKWGSGWGLILCVMHHCYIIKTRQSAETQKKVIRGKGRKLQREGDRKGGM